MPRFHLTVTGFPPKRGQKTDYDAMIRSRLGADDSRMLYEHQFGAFPRVLHDGEVRHGGAACLWGNEQWVEHIEALRRDVERRGLRGFRGLLVLNHEGNYPTWENSSKTVREHVIRHLHESGSAERLSGAQLRERAEEIYNQGQRRFYTVTFGVIRELAPQADLALWSYPRPAFVAEDEAWMMDLVDVLCPAVYFIMDVHDDASRKAMHAKVDSRLSVAAPLAEEYDKRLALYVNTRFNRKVKGRVKELPDDDDYRAVLRYAAERWNVREFIVWAAARPSEASVEEQVRAVEHMLAWARRTDWPAPDER